jgi:predicted ABC-class ATPase
MVVVTKLTKISKEATISRISPLIIDRVQGDPFASPSQVRVQLPQSVAGFPRNLYQNRSREIALRDYLTRQFDQVAREISSRRGTGNSGLIAIAPVGQSVLDRTSAFITDKFVEVRFVVGLPARGRQIAGRQAAAMLCDDISQIVDQTIKYHQLDGAVIKHHVETVEDADWLRQNLGRAWTSCFHSGRRDSASTQWG